MLTIYVFNLISGANVYLCFKYPNLIRQMIYLTVEHKRFVSHSENYNWWRFSTMVFDLIFVAVPAGLSHAMVVIPNEGVFVGILYFQFYTVL